ncbi:hypothetical protein ACFLQN_01480 [Candidatus Aenigmatarchaeota archaeon]
MSEENFGKYNIALIILYIAVLAIIVITFSDVFLLGITLIIIIIITFIQKMHMEDSFDKQKQKRKRFIFLLSEKIDSISHTIERVGNDFNSTSSVLASNFNDRVNEFTNEIQTESEKQYRDLARKILESENKINEVKKNLGIAYGSLDERLRGIEEKEEI